MARMICIFLAGLFFFTGTAISGELPKSLHIGKQQDYPPYIFEKEGKTVGICAELAEAAFKLLDISIAYTQYPFARMLDFGKSGKVDAVMMVFKTQERQAYLHYPEYELYPEENSFFTKKSSHISYSGNLEDLKEYTIGVINGFSYGDQFDHATFIKKDFSLDDDQLVKKLLNDRFQIGVGSKYVIRHYAEKMGILNEIKFLEPNLFDKNPLYIGFTKAKPGYEELTARFSEALAALRKNGHYQLILKKYNLE